MSELQLHLITGGTGRTGELVLRACLAQFSKPNVELILHAQIRSSEQIRQILDTVRVESSLVCHTLVDPELRHQVAEWALHANVPSVDLLGPTLSALGDLLSTSAIGRPGLMFELHREQFERMDAVDFTMAHDDGARLLSLEQADLVITGLSRMSKSVTCFYLASRGIRAANVPLVAGLRPPQELLRFPAQRVFGLTMNAAHLASIRQARLNRITTQEVPNYASIRTLNREIYAAEKLMDEYGWRRVDVSYMATEEVASHIMDELQRDDEL